MLNEKLASLRKEKGLSQYEVADRLNLSRGQLANYEQGSRQPDYDTLKKIATFYEVSLDDLLDHNKFDKDRNGDENFDKEFEEFIIDPELKRWHKELPKSPEEDLRKLRKMWEIIKSEKD